MLLLLLFALTLFSLLSLVLFTLGGRLALALGLCGFTNGGFVLGFSLGDFGTVAKIMIELELLHLLAEVVKLLLGVGVGSCLGSGLRLHLVQGVAVLHDVRIDQCDTLWLVVGLSLLEHVVVLLEHLVDLHSGLAELDKLAFKETNLLDSMRVCLSKSSRVTRSDWRNSDGGHGGCNSSNTGGDTSGCGCGRSRSRCGSSGRWKGNGRDKLEGSFSVREEGAEWDEGSIVARNGEGCLKELGLKPVTHVSSRKRSLNCTVRITVEPLSRFD